MLGITSGLIGLGLIAGLYAIGYLLIPGERGVKFTFFNESDSQQIREGLSELVHSIRFRVSPDVEAAVEDVVRSIILTLPPEDAKGISAIDPTVMLIRQTALHYVPKVLNDYLAIPRMYAERVAISDGKTAKDVLIEQLRMIEGKMKETSLAMYQNGCRPAARQCEISAGALPPQRLRQGARGRSGLRHARGHLAA